MKKQLLICLLLPALAFPVRADVAPAAIFSNHAVLQQSRPIPVWGTAAPGERVTVTFGSVSATSTADSAGKWRVDLPAQPASTVAGKLEIKGRNTIAFDDILVGEVWLASGQSNMEFVMKNSYDASLDVPVALPLVRQFGVTRQVSDEPAAAGQGRWLAAAPETTGYFSAVAFYFARDLHARLGCPVGIIHASWGGTQIESWMPPESLKADPSFAVVGERWQRTLDAYPEARSRYDAELADWTQRKGEAEKNGRAFTTRAPSTPPGPGHQNTPAGLYNGMINPVVPFALRGIIWYQGESNRMRAAEYEALFPALINGWRTRFAQGELPFYWVQLANYRGDGPDKTEYAALRGAQDRTLALPNTGQAVIIDIGDANDIHPRNKLDVGRRLARLALHRTYSIDLVDSGPVMESATRDGAGYRVAYKKETAGTLLCPLPVLTGFEIAGADKVFYPADAKISGREVVVSCPVAVSEPMALRYAWRNAPVAGLVNQDGLPAAPFRTDNW